jgi:predicted N-formylglutamate amidohydrolase
VCIEVRQDTLESPAGVERWIRRLAPLLRDIVSDPELRRLADTESPWRYANPR